MNILKPYRFIEKEEIEERALAVIKQAQQGRKRPLRWPLDSTVIAESMGLDVEWYKIPPDAEGRVAAIIFPLDRKIVINEDAQKLSSGFVESTLAHEIGHWELHINRDAVGQAIEHSERGLEVSVAPFLCRTENVQRGIEWQAQYFAGCLLMPQFKLEELLRGRDLRNWKHLYAMADSLGVTISNLRHRLTDLEWIHLRPGSSCIYLGKNAPSLSSH